MDVREKLVYLVKNALRAYGKDLEKTVEPYEFITDFLLHSGVTVQEWISVADKIPPDQEEVLVLTQSKNGVRNVDKGYWAIDHFIHRGRSEVTHWMPMPNPPKGE